MNKLFRIDFEKKMLVVSREIMKKISNDPFCAEAETIMDFLNEHPAFSVGTRTCIKHENKKSFKGLNVGLMIRYIKATDPESDNYRTICEMERRLCKANLREDETATSFPIIRKWFFEAYPEVLKMEVSDISYETLIIEVENKVNAENHTAEIIELKAVNE